jgi:hypothetical protein
MQTSQRNIHCANPGAVVGAMDLNSAWTNIHTDMRTPFHFPGFNTRLPA